MSKGGGTNTVTQQASLPQWVQDAGQANLAQAKDVSNNLAGPYSGPRVAGMNDAQLSNIGALQNNVGSTQPAFAAAQNIAGNVGTYSPDQVNAGALANTDLSSYMNPYTQNVIGSGMQAIDMQRQQALNQIGDQANRAGAFGGSRQGVQEGVTNAASALQAGNLASQLMSQNYSQAQSAANTDLNRNLQGQGMNQSANLQGAGLNLQGANGLGMLAGLGQQNFLAGVNGAQNGANQAQVNAQSALDAQQQAYAAQAGYPLQQLQINQSALGMTPYGQSSSTTSPVTPTNPLMSGLGGALTGASLGSSLFSAGAMGLTGGQLGGGLGALAGLAFSDERLKTDIQKIGKDPESGLDMYSYRYKGDPKTYPKVVGPMAQDIEKKYPDQVANVGGKLAVNLGFGPMQKAFR
jgi:hypothetical protein